MYASVQNRFCFQLGPSQPVSSLDFLGQPSGLGGLSEIFGLAQSPTYVPPQEVSAQILVKVIETDKLAF